MATTDQTVTHVAGMATGAVAGGLVVAPIAMGTMAALGLAFPPALPLVGILTLAGLWVGHKVTAPTS